MFKVRLGCSVVRIVAGVVVATGLSVVQAAPSIADPAQQVAAHLVAGEFGAALQIAQNIGDPGQQSELLKNIAAAQQAAGEPITAPGRAAIRTSKSAFGGGGSLADFTTLMTMIEQNTNGKWQSVEPDGGTQTPYPSGVHVAPNGLLHRLTTEEHHGVLASLGVQARKADINSDVARISSLRLVSLSRLERAVARRLAEGESIPETMAQLAGISRIRYVLVDPESHEIIIGGPAEGWQYNSLGQPVGATTGRPTLHLDDLVTLLRTFAVADQEFGCSINTRPTSVQALTDFVQKSQSHGPKSPSSIRNWMTQLQQKLGRQDIEIWGVPNDSRVARIIVEADYRMKLIGIDKQKAGKEIPSYFDLLSANESDQPSMGALRWWLTMKYDAVAHSSDRTVFEIQGSSVLCQSENQVQTIEGKHVPAGTTDAANRAFAANFTANYDKLATRDTVFAELQNVFDLALVSALIRHERLNERAGWDLGAFGPDREYVTARYAIPREVDSVANHRVYGGRDVVVQVAGGVQGNVMSVVKDSKRTLESPRLSHIADEMRAPELATGRWWWDAAR